MSQADDLGTAIRRAVTDLPTAQLHKLATSFSGQETPTTLARHTIVNSVPTAIFRHHAAALCGAWATSAKPLSGAAVALAVRVAADAVGDVRREEEIAVVWTGPASFEVPVRATSAVLLDIINEAQRDLIVVSFAAYKVQTVVDALRNAASRGVKISLVLESVADSKGRLSRDASEAFEALDGAAMFYVWPAEKRGDAGQGAMHAKCAVADGIVSFITSANLTGAAMASNMELGIVVRGGDTPRRIASHFNQLMMDGYLALVD